MLTRLVLSRIAAAAAGDGAAEEVAAAKELVSSLQIRLEAAAICKRDEC